MRGSSNQSQLFFGYFRISYSSRHVLHRDAHYDTITRKDSEKRQSTLDPTHCKTHPIAIFCRSLDSLYPLKFENDPNTIN